MEELEARVTTLRRWLFVVVITEILLAGVAIEPHLPGHGISDKVLEVPGLVVRSQPGLSSLTLQEDKLVIQNPWGTDAAVIGASIVGGYLTLGTEFQHRAHIISGGHAPQLEVLAKESEGRPAVD